MCIHKIEIIDGVLFSFGFWNGHLFFLPKNLYRLEYPLHVHANPHEHGHIAEILGRGLLGLHQLIS